MPLIGELTEIHVCSTNRSLIVLAREADRSFCSESPRTAMRDDRYAARFIITEYHSSFVGIRLILQLNGFLLSLCQGTVVVRLHARVAYMYSM